MATFQYRTTRVPPVNVISTDGKKIHFKHGSFYQTSDARDIDCLQYFVDKGILVKKPVGADTHPVETKVKK